MTVAYLSKGRLYLQGKEGSARLVESAFGKSVLQRSMEIQQRHGWKNHSNDSGFMNNGRTLWNAHDSDPQRIPIRLTGISRGFGPQEILYSLQTDVVGGLFRYNVTEDNEIRLFHKEAFRVKGPCANLEKDIVAASMEFPNGTSNLMVVPKDSPFIEEVTEGDSKDEAPQWVPGAGRVLVFQSSGIGRTESGYAQGYSHSTVQRLDLDSGKLETLLDDPKYDYMLPRMDKKGSLYVIRRPYELPGAKKSGFLEFLSDVVALPFRLFRALFSFLDIFSKMVTNKPLMRSGGNATARQMGEEDEQRMWLHGRMIEVKRAEKEEAKGEAPSFIPADWVLVRKDAKGKEVEIAKNVVAFDLMKDGKVAYSDGRRVYKQGKNGSFEKVAKADIIESFLVL